MTPVLLALAYLFFAAVSGAVAWIIWKPLFRLWREWRRSPRDAEGAAIAAEAMRWPAGWFEPTAKERSGFALRLQREVGPVHALNGRTARLIARRHDSDEALYELADGKIAQVHLTWTKNPPERDPRWPVSAIFENLDAWRQYWVSRVEPALRDRGLPLS